MKTLILATTVLASLGSAAFAQTSSPVNSSQMDAASSNNDQKSANDNARNKSSEQNRAAIDKIRQELQSAGFTDVKIVAESFVVQANSKEGNPVLMTIGPQGMSVFEATNSASSNSGTVGLGPNGANSTNSGAGSSSPQNPGTQK